MYFKVLMIVRFYGCKFMVTNMNKLEKMFHLLIKSFLMFYNISAILISNPVC